jgi:copper chaperone NosL
MSRPSQPRTLALAITLVGALLFVLSLGRPWWGMIMFAPQYPDGLMAIASLTHMTGDIDELNELNHYIGMMKLDAAASVERVAAPYVVWAFAGLAVVGGLVRKAWLAWMLRFPLISFPVVFLADLKFWLWYAGNHLDPHAALSSAVKGFTPALLGKGKIAQFHTQAWLEPGFWFAAAGVALVVVAGAWMSRQQSVREV